MVDTLASAKNQGGSMIRALIATAAAGAIGFGLAPTVSAEAQPLGPAPIYAFDVIPASPGSQQNAVRKAQQYLSTSAFSRQGLIEQLEYEGFSTADATYAVDSITVDWDQQAAKKAQQYLSRSAFSRQGLLEQLEYEGFTPSQAAYGVTVAYE